MKNLLKGKIKVGTVISEAMNKSVVVETKRTVMDKRFKKYVKRKKKFMAHDEGNKCNKGDKVVIKECRPLSKRKRWIVQDIVEKAVME